MKNQKENKERKWKDTLKESILLAAKNIGPESSFAHDVKKYEFQDGLKFTKDYFNGGEILENLVLKEMSVRREEINYSFCYQIFDKVIRNIYERIKNRVSIVDKRLNEYLVQEDYDFAEKKLEELLKNCKGEYRLILITNLIELTDVDSIKIGKVLIRKIDNTYVKDFPERISDRKEVGLLVSLITHVVETRKDFLDAYRNHVALEVDVAGYHFNTEKSLVFYSALEEIKRVFAYLFMCRGFLENVSKDTYTIETKDLKNTFYFGNEEPIGVQEYFLTEKGNYNSLRKLETVFTKILISNRIITLSRDSIDQIEKRCYLSEFNRINQCDDNWKIKNKINRSFDWFLKSILEKDKTDEVISLFISMESLLSFDSGPHTDDMAENVAIMLTSKPDTRYEYKQKFKKLYRFRNDIMHRGETFSYDSDWDKLCELKAYVIWSLNGILMRLKEIEKFGKKSEAMRKYFERKKLEAL